MAIEFIEQLHQDSLEKAWNARAAKAAQDPILKRRQNVLRRIDNALAHLQAGDPNPPRGSYQTRDNVSGVRVQLKFGQRALTIDGRDHWFVEDAPTFFRNARQAVESGELDGAINAAIEGKGKARAKAKAKAGIRTKAPGTRAGLKSKPRDLEEVRNVDVVPEGEGSAEEIHPAKPGKYAQKYEKLLAAGVFGKPTL